MKNESVVTKDTSDLANNSAITNVNTDATEVYMYCVRKTLEDAESQIGVYKTLKEAKKNCPGGYNVYNKEGNVVYGAVDPTGTTDNEQDKPGTPSIFPYMVQIAASVVNVRKAPGINHIITTQLRQKGIYTIVDEQNGWGKLKSGAGWIYLGYTTPYSK